MSAPKDGRFRNVSLDLGNILHFTVNILIRILAGPLKVFLLNKKGHFLGDGIINLFRILRSKYTHKTDHILCATAKPHAVIRHTYIDKSVYIFRDLWPVWNSDYKTRTGKKKRISTILQFNKNEFQFNIIPKMSIFPYIQINQPKKTPNKIRAEPTARQVVRRIDATIFCRCGGRVFEF